MTKTKLNLITRKEAADLLGVQLVTIARYLRDGKLTKYKQPGGYFVRVDRAEVERMMDWVPDA